MRSMLPLCLALAAPLLAGTAAHPAALREA